MCLKFRESIIQKNVKKGDPKPLVNVLMLYPIGSYAKNHIEEGVKIVLPGGNFTLDRLSERKKG
jgi:hypothetical protein